MRCRSFAAPVVLIASALVLIAVPLRAAAPRVLPADKQPNDARLGPLKTLNDYFPFEPATDAKAWQQRAKELRRQMLVSQGLWPMPTKTPAGAVVHGRVDRDEYTVQRVYLESWPGHYVTGNLYRPRGKSGRLPAVLCPHGHWPNGRFYDAGEARVKQQVASGGEQFEIGGRYPLQARCVQLARMGCIVFHYDMTGYADSVQLAHRPGEREAMNTASNWGFFSPQAELRLQTMMGLQTYNSIRALDWICSRDDVDAQRIAVTGASGGGTQTFMLCAVDPRPAVAMPCVMVSTSMQGGCTCENAPYLRVGTGNVEFAALFAPKPQGLTAADDWTKDMSTKGFPQLQQHYAMLGAKDNVMLHSAVQYKHNYNSLSRHAMYHWFNRHLKLGQKEPIKERDYQPLTQGEMTVWDEEHAKPPSGDEYERALLRKMTEDSQHQMAGLRPKDKESLNEFRRVVGGAVEVLIGRTLPPASALEWEKLSEEDRGNYLEFTGLLRNKEHVEELPVVFLHPEDFNNKVVIWVHEQGKDGLFGSDGSPRPAVRKLIDSGYGVACLDLFYQGEFLKPGETIKSARLAESGRGTWTKYSGYTFGYNQSLLARRVSDILTLVSFVKNHDEKPQAVHLIGLDGAGLWAAAARAQAGDAVNRAAIDTAGFRFEKLTALDDVNFLPGSVKYGDLPALLALGAPGQLWIAGEGEQLPELLTAAYQTAGAADRVEHFRGTQQEEENAAVEWIVR